MNVYKVLLVGLGGALGSMSRYVIVKSVDDRLNVVFPYGTLAVNIAGSFILGMVVGYAAKHGNVSDNWKVFLGAGLCGGFTTFSSFALENFNLGTQRFFSTSVLYIIVTLVAGWLAVAAGVASGRALAGSSAL